MSELSESVELCVSFSDSIRAPRARPRAIPGDNTRPIILLLALRKPSSQAVQASLTKNNWKQNVVFLITPLAEASRATGPVHEYVGFILEKNGWTGTQFSSPPNLDRLVKDLLCCCEVAVFFGRCGLRGPQTLTIAHCPFFLQASSRSKARHDDADDEARARDIWSILCVFCL